MADLLDRLADAVLNDTVPDIGNVAIVLPSQRAGLFLRKALAQKAGKVLWSPEILTLSTFMERVGQVRTLPMEELLFEAFDTYRALSASEPQPFPEFLSWASVPLRDFSEVDAHLIPLDQLYRDLRSWEELDWSFNTDPLSEGQQRSVRYWALASAWHAALNARSAVLRAGTSGWVSQQAALNTAHLPWSRIWFAGLNAFTPAEQKVIDRAVTADVARFAWDVDTYYLDSEVQEAGHHLRKAIARYGPGAVPVTDRVAQARERISVVRTASAAAQAWAAAALLPEEPSGNDRSTAIVLAEEGLLRPLLEALPEGIGPVNVTMGVPLAHLPVASLITSFLRYTGTHPRDRMSWCSNLEHLLRHPFLRREDHASSLDNFLEELPSLSAERLDRGAGEENPLRAIEDVLPSEVIIGGTDRLFHRLLLLLAKARDNMRADKLATEQLFQTSLLIHRAHGYLEKHSMPSDAAAWEAFLPRLLRSARVGLFGEPLSGVQIMGMLESRALSFDRVILLGAQEGALPSEQGDRSYIPFEIRRHYKLPLRDSTDAVQAYNFLRIVQHANEVVLVHSEEDAAQGPSRFIAQLEQELNGDPSPFPARTASAPIGIPAAHLFDASASADRREQVLALCAKGLSPTALSAWLNCPLDHWFRFVRRLREPTVASAAIPDNILGTALHAALESSFRPLLGRPLEAADLQERAEQLPTLLEHELEKELKGSVPAEGQPSLQFSMATQAASGFLQSEARSVTAGRSIVPLALEAAMGAPLLAASQQAGAPVRLHGRIDRVDVRDGVHTLLDLKTGRVEAKELDLKDLSFLDEQGLPTRTARQPKALQLLIYTWLYLSEHPEVERVRAGVLPLRQASASEGVYLKLFDKDTITRDDMPAIASALTTIVMDMLDPKRPITHDESSAFCRFCADT